MYINRRRYPYRPIRELNTSTKAVDIAVMSISQLDIQQNNEINKIKNRDNEKGEEEENQLDDQGMEQNGIQGDSTILVK